MEGRFCVADTPRRELPPLPNLDKLKKDAKARLVEMRARAPSARLADAQFLLAREHGFSSWAALKAEVERLAASPAAADLRAGKARGALFRAGNRAVKEDENDPHAPGHFFRSGITMIVAFALVALIGFTAIFISGDTGRARMLELIRSVAGRAP